MSRRPRIPGTSRTELLQPLEGEALMLRLVWAVPGFALGNPKGAVLDAAVTDDARVAEFVEHHGPESGRDIKTSWAVIVGQGEVIAVLQVEAGDFEAPLLELAFPLPRAYAYLESIATAGTLALCSLPTGRVIGFDVASNFGVVKAGYAASLLVPRGAA